MIDNELTIKRAERAVYMRAYNAKNPEGNRARSRAYYAKNRTARIAHQQVYAGANKEKISVYQREYKARRSAEKKLYLAMTVKAFKIVAIKKSGPILTLCERQQIARSRASGWRVRNRDRVNANHRQWYAANPDKAAATNRRYAERHPDKILEKSRRHQAKNRDKCAERTRRYRVNNPEKVQKLAKEYRNSPHGKLVRKLNQQRRDALLQNCIVTATNKEIYAMLINAKQCSYCPTIFTADNSATLDHIVALTRGGTHSMDNLTAACRNCNNRKSNLPLNVFLARRAEVFT